MNPMPSSPGHDAATGLRTETRIYTVEELIDALLDGQIRIPAYQRELHWDDKDRLALFDSLYRGFPIGLLFFWQRPAAAERYSFSGLEVSADAREDALWVVDGQQRLATLGEGLACESDAETIWLDLGQEIFSYCRAAEANASQVPVCQLLRSDLSPDLEANDRQRAEAVSRRLRQYQVPVIVADTLDSDWPRWAFERLNSAGKALLAHEFFDGLHGHKGRSTADSLRDIAATLSSIGAGRPDEALIHRCLLAVEGLAPGDFGASLSDVRATEALEATYRGLFRGLEFLKNRAGLVHLALLPSQDRLCILALFFARNPQPGARSLELLSRWLWRDAVLGERARPRIRRILETLRELGEEPAVQALLSMVGEKPTYPKSLGRFELRRSHCKLQLAYLASLRPRHLVSGDELDLGKLYEQQGSHPICRLAQGRSGPSASLASVFLQPKDQAESLRPSLIAASDETLASHAVTEYSRETLAAGDIERFLELRQDSLSRGFHAFLDAKAQWHASDRPSIASLRIEDPE